MYMETYIYIYIYAFLPTLTTSQAKSSSWEYLYSIVSFIVKMPFFRKEKLYPSACIHVYISFCVRRLTLKEKTMHIIFFRPTDSLKTREAYHGVCTLLFYVLLLTTRVVPPCGKSKRKLENTQCGFFYYTILAIVVT